MESCDVLIVGGGAAGIAAAKAAAAHCRGRILLAERAEAPGGVLLQCAHRASVRDSPGRKWQTN